MKLKSIGSWGLLEVHNEYALASLVAVVVACGDIDTIVIRCDRDQTGQPIGPFRWILFCHGHGHVVPMFHVKNVLHGHGMPNQARTSLFFLWH